ncbi:MAG TPA: GNAT family N-acetyltransferase [Acidimicrobiales bacterium]|nr:GNAT family N-acetyltransferase [Acidimicrobiales bacterium]
MRKQYHFWPGEHGDDAWDVDRLIHLSRDLPVIEIDLDRIGEIDTAYWFPGGRPVTVRDVIDHTRLMATADLTHPVILGPDNRVMDGMHRIARAVLDGRERIRAVRFDVLPAPDHRGVVAEDLSYLELRPLTVADLATVAEWLDEPHVAEWWCNPGTAQEQLDEYRGLLAEARPLTVLLLVVDDGTPVGWCQWYRWDDYPDAAADIGAAAGDIGIDYAIGAPDRIGRGVGTALIRELVAHLGRLYPGAGFLAAPEAANVASCRVLEKNGFELVSTGPLASEPHDRPMAVYRRPGSGPAQAPEPRNLASPKLNTPPSEATSQ